MSAGDTTFITTERNGSAAHEYWTLQSNGATNVVIYTKLHEVLIATCSWGEDIGATGHVAELVVDNSSDPTTVTFTASGAISDKKVYVHLVGYP